MQTTKGAAMEFHVSRQARDRYQIDETLFSLSGNVILPNFHAARVLAQKMNDKRDLIRYPEQAVKAGHINTMGLIDEILHYVSGLYREQRNPETMRQALAWLDEKVGTTLVNETLGRFVREFPPLAVYKGQIDPDAYLAGTTGGTPHRQLALEELVLLWLENANPAFLPFQELFDDKTLETETAYRQLVSSLQDFFATQPTFGPENQSLVEMLRSPAVAVPHSLSGQLAYILDKWGYLLDKHLYRLLRGLDLIREEENPHWAGPGPARVYSYTGLELETERFSPDREWMPQLVLMAKNSYVWLDQLSKKYQRAIRRLDEIPDEELALLGRWGFTGLWLIGLWERSRASQKIKQLCGNAEAVASAYSLYDYQIAEDLGGQQAYQELKARAWKSRHPSRQRHGAQSHGHRLQLGHRASGLVHRAGLASVSRPIASVGQTFPRMDVWASSWRTTTTRAAMRPSSSGRLDRRTGSEKYIYHGNDGTSMPWNDTAQLNYLNPEVREAVIQTILHVARQFPDHPFRCGHDAGQETLSAPVVSRTRDRRSHPLTSRAWPDARAVRRCHAQGVLAGSGGPCRQGSAGHSAAGRGVLDDGGILCPHARHAPGLQQRLHEHAEKRGERQLSQRHEEHSWNSIRKS